MEMSSFHATYFSLTITMMLLFRPGQGSTMRIHVYPDSDNRLEVSISTNLTTSVTSGCLERCYSNSQRLTVSGWKYCSSGWLRCVGWDYTATVQNSEFKIDISRYDYGHEVRLHIMCRNTSTSLFTCGDKQTTQAVTRITRGDTTYDVECTQITFTATTTPGTTPPGTATPSSTSGSRGILTIVLPTAGAVLVITLLVIIKVVRCRKMKSKSSPRIHLPVDAGFDLDVAPEAIPRIGDYETMYEDVSLDTDASHRVDSVYIHPHVTTDNHIYTKSCETNYVNYAEGDEYENPE